MPDKSLTVVSYAAGASLAAIALVYVFAPTFAIDESSSSSSRRKGVVGLRNSANDCFINSTLQALAGLGELRVYLIRETHRRNIEDPDVYAQLIQPPGKSYPTWKIEGMQKGLVTQGLKEMLDSLNERPIYKKSISAIEFVRALEQAFRQRISRQQQDAQEFLQIVAERLKEEYHAGARARAHARNAPPQAIVRDSQSVDGQAVQEKLEGLAITNGTSDEATTAQASTIPTIHTTAENGITAANDEYEGFPMEGKYESQSQCQTCGYETKPKEEDFYMLTLNVPQVTSTTLNSCFDEIFKTEYIDDFKCERCRLIHAKEVLEKDLTKSTSETYKARTTEDLLKLQEAIDIDPENTPEGVSLPDVRYAPKRRIARSTRITSFPKVLAIHLSRSIYDSSMSTKNSAKVAFPERLALGGLQDRRMYKLLGLVTHKGSHHSGHYESFRRQNIYPPYSNPNTFQPSGIYSKTASPSSTPQMGAIARGDSPMVSTPDLLTPSSATNSSTPSLDSQQSSDSRGSHTTRSLHKRLSPTSAPRERDAETSSIRSVAASARSTLSKISLSKNSNGAALEGGPKPPVHPNVAQHRHKKRKPNDRWWRISDEKIREAKTPEVLGMQREVYLLFYELEKDNAS